MKGIAMIRRFLSFAAVGVLACLLTAEGVHGQITLYGNTHLYPGDPGGPFGPRFDSPEERLAQQFHTGQSTTISSVSLSLQRVGAPTGNLEIQIWDDPGTGTPGGLLATIGSIDLPDLPLAPTQLAFDRLSVGVDANSSYFVVLDNSGAGFDTFDNSYRFGTLETDEGTFGAGKVLALVAENEWKPLDDPDVLGCHPTFGCANFLHMNVQAIPEPSSMVLGITGLLGTLLVTRRAYRGRLRDK